MTRLLIFPGGFHPFTPAHKKVYDYIEEELFNENDSEVYIATSNSTEKRPFTFEEKKTLMIESGVFDDEIMETKQPYSPTEILQNYNGKKDVCILIISKKNEDRLEQLSEKYEKYDPKEKNLKPFSECFYVHICPEYSFTINGKEFDSASQIREYYKKLDDNVEKLNFLKEMYPDCENINGIFKIFENRLGGKTFTSMISEVKGTYDEWGFINSRGEIISGTSHKKARFHAELLKYLFKERSKFISEFEYEVIEKEYFEDDFVDMDFTKEFLWIRWFSKKDNIVFDFSPKIVTSTISSNRPNTRQVNAIKKIAERNKDKLFSLYLSNAKLYGRYEDLSYEELLDVL